MRRREINHLADLLVMDRTTLTRNLGLLRKQGWARIEVGKDHRMRVVTLTEEDQRVLAQALPLWQQAQSQVFDRLSPQHVEVLLTELSTAVALSHSRFLFSLITCTCTYQGGYL